MGVKLRANKIMETKILNKYLVFYFITAQFILISKRSCWKDLKWLPIIVHSSITCACIYFPNMETYVALALFGSISGIFTLISVLPSILTIAANIFTYKKCQNILKILIDLQTCMENQFGVTFSGFEFTRRHNFKVFLLMGVFLSLSTCRAVFVVPYLGRCTDGALTTMHFFTVVFMLYFLLHIDLLYSTLQFLSKNLDRISNSKSRSDIECLDVLNFVTYVHRKVWECKIMIENRFCWVILVVLLKFVVDIMNSSFWIFWHHDINEGESKVIRKYGFSFT